MCAGYLFQPDKQYDVSYDTGDKAIQCGRHVDIFKFWLMWKAKVNNKSLSQKPEMHLFNFYLSCNGILHFDINVCVITISNHRNIQILTQKGTM